MRAYRLLIFSSVVVVSLAFGHLSWWSPFQWGVVLGAALLLMVFDWLEVLRREGSHDRR
jgi:hypothetical protein